MAIVTKFLIKLAISIPQNGEPAFHNNTFFKAIVFLSLYKEFKSKDKIVCHSTSKLHEKL